LKIDHRKTQPAFCFRHKNYSPEEAGKKSKTPISQRIFRNYSEALMSMPVKIATLVLAATFLGVAIWGTVELEVRKGNDSK